MDFISETILPEATDLNKSFYGYGNDTTCLPPQLHPTSNFVLVFVYLLIVVIGLLGNTLVIYVVLRFSKMQTVTNIYIVNMAIADECFLTSIPFLIATTIVRSWPFGRAMCKIYFTITGINQFTSSTFITIMSADRYIAICHPITSPKLRTPTISKVVAFLAWAASAVMIFPVVLYADAVNDGADGHYSCNIIWPTSNSTSTTPVMRIFNTFTLYSFTLTFAIPVVLILIFYVLVIRKLQTVGPKNKSKELKKSHRKVSKLVLTVITVYVFCWTPYWVGQLVLIFQSGESEEGLQCHHSDGSSESLFVLYHLITSILSTANSAMNPVLYAFLSDNFKKSFLKACVCATKTDVNACLQVENSVFPKRACRQGSEKHRAIRGTSQGTGADEMNEDAQLVSKGDHSTMTTTTTASRSNFTCSSDVNVTGTSETSTSKEPLDRLEVFNNGVKTSTASATAV